MWGKLLLFGVMCVCTASAWGTNFALLLGPRDDGADDDATKHVREIQIDELNIDIREMTTGLDVEYRQARREGWRTYWPGAAHWGSARITLEAGQDTLFSQWYQEAAKGKNIRKNITVNCYRSDNTPVRSYTLFDCFPTQWSSVDIDATGMVQTETLTVKIGRIEFVTRVADPSGGGGTGVQVSLEGEDSLFSSWGGGEPSLILTQLFNSEKFHTTSPGHKSVGEITLRGAMTDGRKALCQWINETVSGKPWKRTLTIKEITKDGGAGKVKEGKQYIYSDCFPCGYVFPRISVDGPPAEQLIEEVRIKPIRCELK